MDKLQWTHSKFIVSLPHQPTDTCAESHLYGCLNKIIIYISIDCIYDDSCDDCKHHILLFVNDVKYTENLILRTELKNYIGMYNSYKGLLHFHSEK